MDKIDKIIFGDNQFFGINHMSQEKAQQLGEKFFDINNIFQVYNDAINNGVQGIMLNSNERAIEICNYFRENERKYSYINWYPSIPYPHKYANLVGEKGITQTLNEVLLKNNNIGGLLGLFKKGGVALISNDAVKLMEILVDIEMKMFKGMNIKVILLQNFITDLLLGFEIKDLFLSYAKYIREKYNAVPGFITQNLPALYKKLHTWKIEEVVLCTSFNKIGYLMSPDKGSYEMVASSIDNNKYQLMAMSVLASGSIKPNDAITYICSQNVDSIVFGASNKYHIKDTVGLINNNFSSKN